MTGLNPILAEFRADGRVPIVLGVTGHRRLNGDVVALEAAVAAECKQLAKRHPNTPFLLLSGLAEGADRLVARVALTTLRECRLIGVLPMPRVDFEADFASAESRAEFAALMDRAVAVEIEPASEGWREAGEERNVLYAKVGAVIAENAQVLFALWDREKSRGTGGTADVVEWFRESCAPTHFSYYEGELSPLDPPEPGLLLQIDPATARVTPEVTKTRDGSPSAIRKLLKRTEKYNRSTHRNRRRIAENRPLLPPGALVEAEETSVPMPEIHAVFAAADALAVKLAKRVRHIDSWIYGLAVIAFIMFSLLDRSWLAVYGYAAVTAVMFGIGMVMWLSHIDERFLEYRALAEAMRVLYFWRLSGITRPAWLCYLTKHSGVVLWVRHAVRAVELQHVLTGRAVTGSNDAQRFDATMQHWIDDQQAYYARQKDKHAKAARGWKRLSNGLLFASYAMATGALIYAVALARDGTLTSLEWPQNLEGTMNTLQLTLGIVAATALAIRGYLARKADEDLVKQYAAALPIFTTAREKLKEAEAASARGKAPGWPVDETLERLGVEALREHGEWLWLRHSRPFDVPQ